MTSPAPSLDAAQADSPNEWERALLDRQLKTLDRLAEMGMAIAGAIQQRATASDAADTVVQHAAMDFARVSRAVRMTLALQSRLVRDFKTPPKAGPAEADNDDIEPGSLQVVWLPPEPEPGLSEKGRLRNAVRQAAEASGLEPETVERLDAEARERLERDDMDRIMHRPFDEIVALICEELGLPQLSSRAPQFAAANGGEDPLADPGAKPGEERVGVGEGLRSPFDRVSERPHTWSG